MYTLTLNQLLQNGYSLGLHDYPIFDENYREVLNSKIVSRYQFNEIGFETPERFIYELNAKMSIIMNYYNDLYNAYTELKTIGFNELLHKSIGYEITKDTDAKTDNTNNVTSKTEDKDNITNHVNTHIDYGKSETYTPRVEDTTDSSSQTQSKQEEDSKNLILTADSPQSQIQANLEDINDWDRTPFVSNGSLNLSNDGVNKQETLGNTVTSHTGDNTTTWSGSDDTNTWNTTDRLDQVQNATDTIFSGKNLVNEHDIGYNFDYMNTYQKILEVLTNIDNCILNELRDLFLYIY